MFTKTNSSTLGTTLLLGTAVYLAGCVSNPEKKGTEDTPALAPLAFTKLQTTDVQQFVDQVSGDKIVWTVSSVDGDLVTQKDQDACTWTSSGDPTVPSTSWSNCGTGEWATGGAKNQKIKGGLWPLAVGNKATYSQRYYNSSGNEASGNGTKRCKVKSVETIEIGDESVDAFRVSCTQDYGDRKSRNYWFARGKGLVRYDTGKDRRLIRTL